MVAAAASAAQKMNSSNKAVKGQPRRRRNRKTKLPMTIAAQSGAMEVCSITNPFCEESKGAKWPDGSSSYSAAVPIRVRVPIVTDSTGRAGFLFTPIMFRKAFQATSWDVGGSSVTAWDGLPLGDSFGFNIEDIAALRVVSGGIKFVCTLSQMNAQGQVTLVELPPNEDQQNINDWKVDFSNQNKPTYVTLPLRDPRALYGMFRPLGPGARNFEDPTVYTNQDPPAVISTFASNDWTPMAIWITGAPASSTVGFVDYYLNVELEFDALSNLSVFARPAPPKNETAVNVSQNITRHSTYFVGDDQQVDESFMGRASRFFSGAGRFLADNAKPLLEFGTSVFNAKTSSNMAAGAKYISNRRIMDVD